MIILTAERFTGMNQRQRKADGVNISRSSNEYPYVDSRKRYMTSAAGDGQSGVTARATNIGAELSIKSSRRITRRSWTVISSKIRHS